MSGKEKSLTQAVPKFALVKWLTGDDRGKYSTVDSSWLVNFSLEEFENKKCESYVVEWRDQKKQPLGGWACFDADVIKLSDLKTVLERELSSILQEKEGSKSGSSKKGFPELMFVTNSDDSIADPSYEPSSEYEEMNIQQQVGQLKKREGGEKEESEATYKKKYKRLKKEMATLKKQNECVMNENTRLKLQLADEIPTMLAAMRDVVSSSSIVEQRPVGNVEKVDIFPGSEVYVDAAAWLSAKACSTAGSFIGRLLVSLFPKDVLIRSNLKGGAPKSSQAQGLEKKERLDPRIIAAIKGAAKTHYPDLKDGQFGIYVNQKIANLRSKEKKGEKEQEKAYNID